MALIKLAGSRKIERRGTEFELSVSVLSWGRECEPWRQMMRKKQVDSNVDAPVFSLGNVCWGGRGLEEAEFGRAALLEGAAWASS